jgi:hypothetical protein
VIDAQPHRDHALAFGLSLVDAAQRWAIYDDYAVDTGEHELGWERGHGEMLSYDQAVSYCDDLAAGGFTDWRVPDIQKLYGSCYDLQGCTLSHEDDSANGLYEPDSGGSPYVDHEAFPDTPCGDFWSLDGYSDYDFAVDFCKGSEEASRNWNDGVDEAYIRCVSDSAAQNN